MPVQHGPDNSPLAFYWAIPPVTRTLATVLLATKLAMSLGVLPLQYIYLDWPLVFWKLQIWRLVTCFAVLPGKPFEFLLQMVWTVQYGKVLESSTFNNNTADFLWMLMFGAGAMLVLTLVPFLRVFFLANALTEMLLYVWSRNYPTSQVSLFGLVTLQAFYLPFVYMGLAVVMGGDWRPSVIGILAGHLYYYLTAIYPASGGQRLVQTPAWLKRLLFQYGIGQVDRREVPQVANPAAPGFRAFQGTGRRLT